MSDKTGIEWTDATWNPVRGCSRPPSRACSMKRASKYKRRPRDLHYMAWIRRQPCAARALTEGLAHTCDGSVEADHAGRRCVGQKAEDRTCIPLCSHHHAQRASFHGVFKSWNQAKMRAWLTALVLKYQLMYDLEHQ